MSFEGEEEVVAPVEPVADEPTEEATAEESAEAPAEEVAA